MKTITVKKTIEIITPINYTKLKLPLFNSGISAGFPSPAEDFIDREIDLNKELIKNPASTFYGRVNGDSLKDLGICHGDLMIIDRCIKPKTGKIAVCYIDGEFTVKMIEIEEKTKTIWLIPANSKYQPIKVTNQNDFIIWGIVKNVIKDF